MKQTGKGGATGALLHSTHVSMSIHTCVHGLYTHISPIHTYSMTTGAQQALRRIMELYSNTTRFALACNQSSKIIEPIQSRCAIVRYTKLNDTQVLARLLRVCEKEQVAYTKEGLEAVIFTADGDMRQALNNLQATVSGFTMVTPDNVFKVCDQPPPLLVSAIVGKCAEAQLEEAYEALKVKGGGGHMCTYIHCTLYVHALYIQTDTQGCTYTHTHTYAYICPYTYTYTYTQHHTHIHTYTNTCMYTHTYIYMHIHTTSHTYTRTHTFSVIPPLPLPHSRCMIVGTVQWTS